MQLWKVNLNPALVGLYSYALQPTEVLISVIASCTSSLVEKHIASFLVLFRWNLIKLYSSHFFFFHFVAFIVCCKYVTLHVTFLYFMFSWSTSRAYLICDHSFLSSTACCSFFACSCCYYIVNSLHFISWYICWLCCLD